MSTILLVLLVLLLVGGIGSGPWYGYSRGWGYGPSGILGLLFLLLLLYLLFGGTAHAAEPCALSAQGVRVVDGDTIVVETSWLGVGHVRLRGIDAPELNGPCQQEREQAQLAKAKLQELVQLGTKLTLHDLEPDKYGRMLATVTAGNKNLSDTMIAAGVVRPYNGGTRQPWCQ
jgi:endonuclease YncB( thermonuclease family)